MLLQGPEALKGLRLLSHMSQKLLKGKQVADQSFDGQRFDELLFVQDLHTASFGVQMQDDMLSRQMDRDIIALEIETDRATTIDCCRSKWTPSKASSQASGSTSSGSAGKAGR
jgi:hypothetical protein